MKKEILIATVLVLIGFAGCKKDASSFSGVRVKTVTRLWTNSTIAYTYDSNGRISTYIDANGNSTAYSYSNLNVYVEQYYNGTVSHDTIQLNSDGYIGDHKHFYDSDGFLIREEYYTDTTLTSVTTYTISNQNIITEASGSSIYYCSFYTNTINTIGMENIGQLFYGRSSKNLVKQLVQVAIGGTGHDTLYNQTSHYDFYNNGNVKTAWASDQNGVLSDTISFTYY